ncbi:hypothetical protein KIH74_05130 [Kineosporia sp. J2-2]|uniref:Uncharacterized protein n=1 Tax=Kineosporia corallincola TaxID=2835133 RepID=A0ABS5TFA8_9ACTN|nr:hypothetical protein [Kineosporia corallincola]MBT0768294.1 hypothetical protein [Kineosporia corallincola]
MQEHLPGPAAHRLTAMASTRESWRLVEAYIEQEFPTGPTAVDREILSALSPTVEGRKGRLRKLFRRRVRPSDLPELPDLPTVLGLGVLRPVD